MVNRVWQHLFGTGLVASPNDFGATGQAPTHLDLLDHLAVRLMESGWSVKGLIRELVLTRTYRQSADHDERAYERDPGNTLLWRHSPRRMDAEVLRDNLLLVSGNLDLHRPLGSAVAMVGDGQVGRRLDQARLNQPVAYRSVYLPMLRDEAPEALALFDLADSNRVTGEREVTNIPSQALYLMNHPFMIEQSEAFARRLQDEDGAPGELMSPARQRRLSLIENPSVVYCRVGRAFFFFLNLGGLLSGFLKKGLQQNLWVKFRICSGNAGRRVPLPLDPRTAETTCFMG